MQYNYILNGKTTSWTAKVTNSFTTSNGVNIIETDGPNNYAWYVTGNSLYLNWGDNLGGTSESEQKNLPSNWWQHCPVSACLYSKY